MYLYGERFNTHMYIKKIKKGGGGGCYYSMKGITVYSSTIDENEEDCRILYFLF